MKWGAMAYFATFTRSFYLSSLQKLTTNWCSCNKFYGVLKKKTSDLYYFLLFLHVKSFPQSKQKKASKECRITHKLHASRRFTNLIQNCLHRNQVPSSTPVPNTELTWYMHNMYGKHDVWHIACQMATKVLHRTWFRCEQFCKRCFSCHRE